MYKKGDQFLIPIESFCALDYKNKSVFFLKETLPEIHGELASRLLEAYDVSEHSGDFPYNYYHQCKKHILRNNKLPLFIPVQIIDNDSQTGCYQCVEWFSEHVFVLSENLLVKQFKDIDKYLKMHEPWDIDMEKMESLFNSFFMLIHSVPKKENESKKRKKKRRP